MSPARPAAAPVLAIDAGNTRIKWGLHAAGRWKDRGSVASVDGARLVKSWRGFPRATRAIASNVAGDEVRGELERACESAGIALDFARSQRSQLGVTSGYRNPGQLGVDRWAALIGAHHAHAGHKLVVSVGTAMTIDALEASGRFRGGLIVPGPALMRRSLEQATAGLRLTEGKFERFPSGTPSAITSGSVQACVGAIERLRQAMADAGIAPERIIVSGGAAGEILAHLPTPAVVNENLVLDGLLLIARSA